MSAFWSSGEFYSTLCALFWAVAVILFRKSGERVPPVALNLFKGTIGLLMFAATMLLLGRSFAPLEATATDWIVLLVSGMLGIGIADSLFFAALNRLGAGRLAVVDCLYSPFVILCSIIYLQEPLTPWVLLAVALLAAAILLGTFEPSRVEGSQARRAIRLGAALGILSMLLMAIGIVMVKPILDRSEVWWATTVRLAGGWAFLAVQAAWPSQRRAALAALRPSRTWWLTVPAAVVGTYLSLLFWILGMKYTYTTIASVLNQLSTIFMLILATIFLREPLTPRRLIAILLGFGGGVLAVLG